MSTRSHGVDREGSNAGTTAAAAAPPSPPFMPCTAPTITGRRNASRFEGLQLRDAVFAEAIRRLDAYERINDVVPQNDGLGRPMVRVGESSAVSVLYVDDSGLLLLVDASLDAST